MRTATIAAGSLVIGAVLGLTVLSPGIGSAATNDATSARAARLCDGRPAFVDGDGPIQAAADAIGIDASALVSDLRDGETIAEVAQANDVAASDVVDAVAAGMQARLDDAVDRGWMTKARADEIASTVREEAARLVNGELPAMPDGRVPRAPGGVLPEPGGAWGGSTGSGSTGSGSTGSGSTDGSGVASTDPSTTLL